MRMSLAESASPGRFLILLAAVALIVLAGVFWPRGRQNPDLVWRKAEDALSAGRIEEAAAQSELLKTLREPTPLDWMLRGQVALAEEKLDEGIESLRNVPDDHVMAPQARLMAGQIELRRNRARIAEQYLREALRLQPTLVQAHRELIYILGYQLRRQELNAEFQALANLTELTFDNAFHWGLVRVAIWEAEPAAEVIERFLAADPDDRWSRLALTENYRRMRRYDDAKALLAPLPTTDSQAQVIRIQIAFDLQQDAEAEALFNESLDDGNPDLARLRGRRALARRDADEAIRDFQQALDALPEDRDAVLGLMNALSMKGETKAADKLRETSRGLERLNSLIQRAGNRGQRENPELLRELGSACVDLSRDDEARAWYRLAIEKDPLDQKSQQALFRLDTRMKAAAKSREPHPDKPASSPPRG